ncbi:MAG: hypothetical protein AAFP08_09255, partial [Bacteroidota bacterium]
MFRPEEIGAKIPEWGFSFLSKKEVEEYFNWFKQAIPNRLQHLKSRAKIEPFDFSRESLLSACQWFDQNVTTRERSPEEIEQIYASIEPKFRDVVKLESYDLDIDSHTLVIEMGIYFAECIKRNVPDLFWYYRLGSKKHIVY